MSAAFGVPPLPPPQSTIRTKQVFGWNIHSYSRRVNPYRLHLVLEQQFQLVLLRSKVCGSHFKLSFWSSPVLVHSLSLYLPLLDNNLHLLWNLALSLLANKASNSDINNSKMHILSLFHYQLMLNGWIIAIWESSFYKQSYANNHLTSSERAMKAIYIWCAATSIMIMLSMDIYWLCILYIM